MRIPKRVITKVANRMLRQNHTVTQLEVQKEIEKYLKRKLSKYEKARITLVLEEHYRVKRRKIDPKTKRKVIYFTF